MWIKAEEPIKKEVYKVDVALFTVQVDGVLRFEIVLKN